MLEKEKTINYRLCSALNNLDQLSGTEDPLCKKIEKDFSKFFDFFLRHAKYNIEEMYKSDEMEWEIRVISFSKRVDETIEKDINEDHRQAILLISKVCNAMNSITAKDKEGAIGKMAFGHTLNRLQPLVSKPYVKELLKSYKNIDKLEKLITEVYGN